MYFQSYKKKLGSIPLAKYPLHKCSKNTFAEEMVTIDINNFTIGLNLLTKYHLGRGNKQTFSMVEILRNSNEKNITR